MDIAGLESVEKYQDLPLTVVIPSFMINELREAFIMGFVIYLPLLNQQSLDLVALYLFPVRNG